MERICCYINEELALPCQAKADWEIIELEAHPLAGTVDSCELHVWELLTDAEVQHVYQILGEDHYGGWKYEIKRAGAPR